MGTRRREVALAGHRGDLATARAALADLDPDVREIALGASRRLGVLSDDDLRAALADQSPAVRRRAAELASTRPGVDLLAVLAIVAAAGAAWSVIRLTTMLRR